MAAAVNAWHREHVRFRRLLDLLDQEVAKFHVEEHPDYDLMRDIVHYLRNYSDLAHHPREDMAFSRLAERDQNLRLPIARLQQEHRVIASAGEALLARLDDVAADVMVERTALEAAAATYLVYYRHHIAAEEKDVLPRAAALLTDRDWAAIASAVPARSDPLSGDNVVARYRELSRRLAR
jgi:hemerythrin-like domain-containing protein